MNRSSNEYVEVPEGLTSQQAEAYRAGYERARRGAEPTVRVEREGGLGGLHGLGGPWEDEPWEGETTQAMPRVPAARRAQPAPGPEARGARPASGPEARGTEGRGPERRGTRTRRRRRSLLPVLVAVASLVAVALAFGIGRLAADDGATGSDVSASGASSAGDGEAGAEPAPYDGAVEVVQATGASASCQAADSVDEAGNAMSYPPARAIDADLSTAWRCAGSGVGQTLTLQVSEGTRVAEVGLVPGYAKSDPVSGTDRYAENNRITRVRWTFADGSSYVQRMSGDAQNRSLRTRRVPATDTGTVTLEVLASDPGPRDTIAVSEVRIATPAD